MNKNNRYIILLILLALVFTAFWIINVIYEPDKMAIVGGLFFFGLGFGSVIYCKVRLKSKRKKEASYEPTKTERMENVTGYVIMAITTIVAIIRGLFYIL